MKDVLKLKKVSISLKHFLKIAVAKLRDQIDFGEIFQILAFGDNHIDHLNNARVLTVLK